MRVSRRQLLTSLWGASLSSLSAGCSCERRFDGELRGPDARAGHRLRGEPPRVEHASGDVQRVRVRVAVVGAGPSGLSAAWKLRRKGEHDYRVFDLERFAGGTSAFGTRGQSVYPWGAHYVPLPLPHNEELVELLDDVGVLESREPIVAKEQYLARAPEERLFQEGRWFAGLYPRDGATPEDLDELRRFEAKIGELVDFRDARGRRAFTVPSAGCSDVAELVRWDGSTADDWMRQQGFTSERLRWYVEYACRDDYGTTLEQTSAWAMLFYFASRRRSGDAESQPFVTWPEGNGALVRHLADHAGERLRLGQMVTDVVPEADRVKLAVLDVASGTLSLVEAEQVILATPRFVMARIYRPFRERPPPWASQLSYGAWLVANLHLSGRPRSNPPELAWDSVLYQSPSLGYVDVGFQALRDRGATTFTYYYPLTHDDPAEARDYLLNAEFDDLSEGIRLDLETAHPDLGDYVQHVEIWRWGHAMIRPTPGTIFGTLRGVPSEPHPRVQLAHTDASGIALFEEAQYWGIQAALRVLSLRG